MKFELPFPPSVNTMFPSSRNGGRHLSKRGAAYRQNVIGAVLESHGLLKPLTGPLSASVELLPPDHKVRDIDNFNKAIFDSLKHAGVMEDDKQIKELHVFMREPSKEPGAIVIIDTL